MAKERNGTRLTPRAKEKFCETLRKTCNVSAAARSIAKSRQAVYKAKEKFPQFSEDWDNALEEGVDRLEGEAHRRAFEGVKRKVFYKDEVIDVITLYSDRLTEFLLKSHRPEKHRETASISATASKADDGSVKVTLEAARERLLGKIDDYAKPAED